MEPFTINSGSTISLDAGSQDVQSVCVNTAISAISYTIGNGATNVTASNLPAGVTGVLSGSIYTLSGTPNTAESITILCQPLAVVV
ncbi:MAG: hypothetical protein U0X58_04040 [Flavobacteriaceae bacterium]